MLNFARLKPHQNKIILLVIIVVGLILRSNNILQHFGYGHDADLFSWMVKDIVINHHFRLIGQLTSTPGIFIGPLYYYALVPFYFVTNMDPIGAFYFTLFLSICTILSFYFIFRNLFDTTTGLIAAFLHAVLITRISYDIWVVPTVLVSIWSVWYLYTLITLSKGNYKVLWILGLLIGLIWHINLGLFPVLLAVPLAFYFAKKLPTVKQVLLSLGAFVISSLPLILFEVRHSFSQTGSFVQSFLIDQGSEKGIPKFLHVLDQISGNITQLILAPERQFLSSKYIVIIFLICVAVVLIYKKVITRRFGLLLLLWFIGVVLFFSLSSKLISEYYFENLSTVFFTIIIVALSAFWKRVWFCKYLILLLFVVLIVRSYYYISYQYTETHGYAQRKAVAEYITQDAKQKGYPCVAVSYITMLGENVGFRYFFYLNNLYVNPPSKGGPIYNIVIPYSLVNYHEITFKSGTIGVTVPQESQSTEELRQYCQGPNPNLTDPMFGYTD
jgi:hypothetical protein